MIILFIIMLIIDLSQVRLNLTQMKIMLWGIDLYNDTHCIKVLDHTTFKTKVSERFLKDPFFLPLGWIPN